MRQEDRDARADAQKFDVRNRAQPAQQIFQLLIAQQQRVAAAQQHVADFRMLRDVCDLPVEFGMEIVAAGVADQPRARAITAIRGAAVGDQEQHAVGIAMHEAGHGRMRIFAARVAHFPRRGVRFLDARNDLPADRAIFIRRINQVEKIRRDGERELVVGQFRAGQSMLNALKLAAADGLMPDGREGAIVPYGENDDGRKTADTAAWMPMIAGIRKKLRNSGQIADLFSHCVYEGDKFRIVYGFEQTLEHEPALVGGRTDRKMIGVYSCAILKDGTRSFTYMNVKECEEIRDNYSKAKKGPMVRSCRLPGDVQKNRSAQPRQRAADEHRSRRSHPAG